MLLKYGVNPVFSKEILEKIELFDRLHLRHVGREAIVTSGNDGEHMSGSLHYVGMAVDFRTRDLSHLGVMALVSALRDELGEDWDVLIEPTHIHVEYDPKGKDKKLGK